MNRQILILLATFWIVPAFGADMPPPGGGASDNMVVDVGSISVLGSWESHGNFFETYPGKFTITANGMLIGGCKTTSYKILHDEVHHDSNWYITGKAGIKTYRDIAIEIQPVPECLVKNVIRFLLTVDNPCFASVLLYDTEEDWDRKRYSGWGSASNLTCYAKLYPSH